MKALCELFAYRTMIASLVKRDLRGKYAASFFGFLWTFMNPFLQLVVYTIVFSLVFKNSIEQFYLFLFIGLVPWIFFASSLTGGSNCVISQAAMLKKIYFPRLVLPVAFATTQLVNMLLTFTVVFAVILFSGRGFNFVAILYLPIIVLVEYFLVIGVTLLTSSLTVYLRDLSNIFSILTMLFMYSTPVVYSIDRIPASILPYYSLNPMVPIIGAYRDILYYKRIPDLTTLFSCVLLGFVVFIVGVAVFSVLNKGFAEEL